VSISGKCETVAHLTQPTFFTTLGLIVYPKSEAAVYKVVLAQIPRYKYLI